MQISQQKCIPGYLFWKSYFHFLAPSTSKRFASKEVKYLPPFWVDVSAKTCRACRRPAQQRQDTDTAGDGKTQLLYQWQSAKLVDHVPSCSPSWNTLSYGWAGSHLGQAPAISSRALFSDYLGSVSFPTGMAPKVLPLRCRQNCGRQLHGLVGNPRNPLGFSPGFEPWESPEHLIHFQQRKSEASSTLPFMALGKLRHPHPASRPSPLPWFLSEHTATATSGNNWRLPMQ